MTCHCQSGESYDTCCQPYHQGVAAPTPEALMRSRYSAYCRGLVDYLIRTTHREHPEFRRNKGDWRVELACYCRGLQGLGLVIVATEPATAHVTDQTLEGWTTFKATLQVRDEPESVVLSERSHFLRDDAGRWLYHSGTATVVTGSKL